MQGKNFKQTINQAWIGAVAGLILPIIVFFLYYLLKGSTAPFQQFLGVIKSNNAFVPIVSLCILPNLALYFISKRLNLWYTIKGIVMSVFVYTLVVIVLKFA